MNQRIIYLIVIALLSFNWVFAQNMQISGVVTDAKSQEPLIGVKVLQKGTTHGVVTNLDGEFSIAIPAGAILEISYIGYVAQTFVVKTNEKLFVQLSSVTKELDEVVVIGYGTARKRDLTGAISSISGDDLKKSPNNNPLKSLQGKVPGLLITNSGYAGAAPTVRLRGVATVNAGTQPLYVVDGMFMDNIDFINQSDITTMEVLKDPSSLAIFGVQGANGVIIITTKRADKNKLSMSYDGYVGQQVLLAGDRVKLTNATDFTSLYNELLKNMDPNSAEWIPDLMGGGTNWMDHTIRPALITNHSVSVSQSNEKSSTVMSLGYFLQDGIVKYNSYERFTGRLASDFNVSKFFKTGLSMAFTKWDLDPASASVQNTVQALPTYSPFAPVSDHDPNNIGSYYTPSPGVQKDVANPVALMEIGKGNSENYGYRGVGNVYGEISFLKDFTFRATGYADVGINFESVFSPRFDVNNSTSNSSHKREFTSFSRNSGEYKKLQADFILNYNTLRDKHRIGGMLGYTARVQEDQGFSAATDTIADGKLWVVPKDMWMLSAGSDKKKYNSDWYRSESFISYLSRVSYSYADKYLATATFRIDGSSKFAKGQQWGYFPAFGLGWVLSEESFFEPIKSNVSYLKLKTSWGRLGNDKIGDYLQYPKIDPRGQQVVVDGVVYYLPTVQNVVDSKLHWEVVSGYDAGIESRMFGNRLSFEFGVYTKTTNDLLAFVPSSAGITVPTITNAGSLRNSGIEYIISWNDKIGEFGYSFGINGSTVKNKVLELGNNNADIVSSTYHITRVGNSVGAIYGYVQDGIFQNQSQINNAAKTSWISKPGDIQYKDLDNDGSITVKDRVFIGNTIPSFIFGFNLGAKYKGFDFLADINGVTGNKIINTKKLPSFTQFNYYETALNRWHGEGTSNSYPILDNTRGHNFLPSTNLLENGAYIRLRNVQLGYNIPKSIYSALGLSHVRVYANVQNLLTFKSNSGFTPEVGGSLLSGSVDDGGTYPLPTTYSFGLYVNF